MPTQNSSQQTSPFEIVTSGKSKKPGKTGLIVGILIIVFLGLSIVAGVLLVQQQQNVQEKAAVVSPLPVSCPAAAACPLIDPLHNGGDGSLLRNCYPAQADNTPKDSQCNAAGRVAPCGPAHTQYCCPSAGGVWTTDMTVCNSLSASPTPTPTPTVAGTSTATPTPTPTSSSSQSSCNGSCSNNSNCQSGLYCYSGSCRNPICSSDSSCSCGSGATPTPTPTTAGSSGSIPTSAPITQTTPRPIPVTGTDWPTVAGAIVGVSVIIASIFIAL